LDIDQNKISVFDNIDMIMKDFDQVEEQAIKDTVQKNWNARDDKNKINDEMRKELYKPLIIVGPSGVGKSTLINHLTAKYPDMFGFSVSYTTRAPRAGEKHGVNYFYIEKEEFLEMEKQDGFIESCHVHNNSYGTAKSQITSIRESKKIPLLDIDIQGTIKFCKCFPNTNTLFILPPSIAELEARLRKRGTETEESLKTRIGNSINEIKQGLKNDGDTEYSLIGTRIVNADLELSKSVFTKLIEGTYQEELGSK